jgi:hypothetical protein
MFSIKSPVVSIWLCALCLLPLLTFPACKTAPADSREDPSAAEAAARDALARMDGGQPAPASASASASAGGEAPRPAVQTGARPAWVDAVTSVYSQRQYLAAVGYAGDRAMAEKNALGNLAAIFGQSIQADQTATTTYQEAMKNGVTAKWSENTALENTIQTSTSMDTLAGAEIRNVWFDKKNTYYAAAVMEKAKAAALYNDMIKANQTMIANLAAMDQGEKNSLEGFARYQFAAAAADMNISYGNVLKVIGAAPPEGLVKGDQYRLEAANIARTIPVGVAVKNDRAGRIRGAFARALADMGFRNGGNDSRYIVEAELYLSEVQYPNQQNKFTRYEVAANLADTHEKTALVPYNINGREGHTTLAEAENRALSAAERRISEEYKTLLSDYLSRLLPKK